ncbi:MAG: DNA-binding protein [Anaeroplasmataceae bacterium]|nr:DNA-binding protein [Anaeroplasmataceae bacterium]
MTVEKREEIIGLYDTYNLLLTDKQRAYFESYYFDDLSISEIAINFEVSRNAVFDQIKRVTEILKDYEEKLKLMEKISKIENLKIEESLREEIRNILKE